MIHFRYPNILPYDFNRVKLKTAINGMDYINASFITGIHSGSNECKTTGQIIKTDFQDFPARFSNISFLASQGPLANTCAHHLQMILENNVQLVIMLTKIREGDGRGEVTLLQITFSSIHFKIFEAEITKEYLYIIEKCEQYWPSVSNKTRQFGHIEIRLKNEKEIYPDITKRMLEVYNINDPGMPLVVTNLLL